MEYNLDGMAPLPSPNRLKRFWYFISSAHYGRTLGILAFLLIALVIPLTTLIVQRQTSIQQKAAQDWTVEFARTNGGPSIKETDNPELYLKITRPDSWTLAQSRTTPANLLASFVDKAYAQSACPGVCVYEKDVNSSTCTPRPAGHPACTGYPVQGTVERCDSEGICETVPNKAYCYTGASCQGLPPAGTEDPQPTPTSASTPSPTEAPATLVQCVNLNVVDSAVRGTQSPFTARYTGNPARIKLSAQNPEERSGGGSWKTIAEVSAAAGGETNGVHNTDLLPGRYTVSMQLITSNGQAIQNSSSACNDIITITNGTEQPTESPSGQITLYQIHIENIDGGSGGTSPQRITGAAALASFFANPYWKLNPNSSGTTRTIQVDFYGRDAQGNEVQKQISASITYTGSAGTPPTPTMLPPGRCRPEFTPFEIGTDLSDGMTPEQEAQIYKWVAVNRQGQPNSCNTDGQCAKNSDCPINDKQKPYINDTTEEGKGSAWCYGFSTGPRCLQLRYIGNGTNPPPVPAVPAGQPTPTPPATCLYSKTSCSTNQRCIDESIAPGWCYAGKCLSCPAPAPVLPTDTNPPPPTPTRTPTPTITSTGMLTPSPTPTVTPTGTLTPTPSPTPTVGPTATATPIPPGTTTVSLSVSLTGVGPKGRDGTPQAKNNPNPKPEKRDLAIYFYEPGVDPSGDINGQKAKWFTTIPEALVYDNNGKFVAKDIVVDPRVTTGEYQILVKSERYLRKRIPGIKRITAGSTNPAISQIVTLALGDANGDNILDTRDYNLYFSCLGKQTDDCKRQVDFNSDGNVDTKGPPADFTDYALFTEQFALQKGD